MTQKIQKIERKEVEKLAALARITIPEHEIEKVRTDMEVILAYVSQINEANDLVDASGKSFNLSPQQQHNFGVKNIMREDGEPHETGKFTDVLLASAPNTEKGYIKVKKIL